MDMLRFLMFLGTPGPTLCLVLGAWCSSAGKAACRSCRRSSSKDGQGQGFGYLCATVLHTTIVERKNWDWGQGSNWRERGEKAEGVWRRRRSVWRERETETERKERQEERAGNRDLGGATGARKAWKSQTDILGKEGD